MVKKLLALAASVLMLVGTAPTVLAAGPTDAPQVVVKISSDKTTAYPGDEITFSVSVTESEVAMAGAQFTLDIPDGLKFVSSEVNEETFKNVLGYDYYSFEDSTLVFLGYSSKERKDLKANVELLTFKCKVEKTGDYSVDFDKNETIGFPDIDADPLTYEIKPATLKVTEKPVAVTGVTVSPTSKTLKEKGETFSITATVAPANATNKAVTYKSSDEKVATVDANGKVTAVANGKATITVTTADGGKTAKCEVTVDIPHKHTMTKVEAKAASCSAEGNKEYYKCTECGKLYEDADGKTETTAEKVTIAKLPHTFDKQDTADKYLASKANCVSPAKYYYSCSVCGAADTKTFDVGEKDPENHANVVVKNEVKATEEADGYTGDKVCADCGTEIEKGKVAPKLVHMADVTKVEAKKATETTDGNIEYYICNSCGKLYKDVEGKTEITLKDTVIKATGKPAQPPKTETNPTTGAATAAFVTGALALAVVSVMKKKK